MAMIYIERIQECRSLLPNMFISFSFFLLISCLLVSFIV